MTRDQFLCEMIGECWHEFDNGWVFDGDEYCNICVKCGNGYFSKTRGYTNHDFSAPADAYRLMQFVMAQEWWCKFVEFAWGRCIFSEAYNFTHEAYFTKWLFSDPDRFAGLVAEYRGWRND